MTDLPIPRVHASTTNYAAGPAVGTSTKTDPGSALASSGIVPGSAYAAQHMNHTLNTLTRLARRQVAALMTPLSVIGLHGTTPSDSSDSMGVISTTSNSALLVKGNTGGVLRVGDCGLCEIASLTSVAAITSECRALARGSSGRILAIGVGGNENAFTINEGTSWTAGGATGLLTPPRVLAWNGTRFILASSAGGSAYSSNGATWLNPAGGSDISTPLSGGNISGLAVLSGGVVVAAGSGGTGNPAFARSTDSGITWAAASGTVASAASYSASGTGGLAGNTGAEVYWLGNTGTVLNLFASPDGNTWTLRSSITGLALSAASIPKLLMCQDSGVLVAIIELSTGGFAVHVSADSGHTWSELILVHAGATHAFGIARGRLFVTVDAAFLMSLGLGVTL